jgi:cbb3-type cytochrome oxidase subunit 3
MLQWIQVQYSRYCKTLILAAMLMIVFFGILSPFKTVQAQTSSVNITDGLGEIQQQTQLSSNLPQIIGNIVRVVFGLLGIILFLLFFYAGFIWMTARGNDEQVDKAKRIIKNAIIGTVVVLLSYALSQGILYLLGVGRNNTGGLFGGSGADVTQGNFDGSGALGGLRGRLLLSIEHVLQRISGSFFDV